MKEKLGVQSAKKEFVKSIHKWLCKTLKDNNHEDCISRFQLQENSIICELPSNYFNQYEIPEGMKVEMKFTVKKG